MGDEEEYLESVRKDNQEGLPKFRRKKKRRKKLTEK